MGVWSSGMILTSGARGHEFNSHNHPKKLFFRTQKDWAAQPGQTSSGYPARVWLTAGFGPDTCPKGPAQPMPSPCRTPGGSAGPGPICSTSSVDEIISSGTIDPCRDHLEQRGATTLENPSSLSKPNS